MSFMEKAQGWLGKFTNKPQQGSDPAYTQRADGSTSGYHPNTQRMKPQPAPQPQPEPVPQWQPEPGYVPPQQMGAAPQADGKPSWLRTGRQKPVQEQPPMGYTQQQAPQQGYTQQMNYQQVPYQAAPQPTGYTQQQPQMGYQQPAPQMQQPPMGQDYRGGFTPTWQQPVANVPGSPFEGYVGANQTMNQPAMNSGMGGNGGVPNNIVYMNGVTVGQDGTAYRHSMRVAQITTVPDCYRLVAFMRSGESVLVNLDEMNETEEMGRCLDLLYGAAYALQCTFTRVANRCLYLITPADILVQPYDTIAEESDREIDARWPDPASVGYMQRNAQREQQKYGHFTQKNVWDQPQQPQMNSFGGYPGYEQNAYPQQFAAGGDPVGFGNRAARAQNTGYTDFGGFGGLGGRR